MNNTDAVAMLREIANNLDGYADSYGVMHRDKKSSGSVLCKSVEFDIRNNMKGFVLAKIETLAATANIADGREGQCNHRVADARNPVITSGYICVDCGALFAAADHERAATAAKDAAEKPAGASFEAWCKLKGLDANKCDNTNCWIRYAFEGGQAAPISEGILPPDRIRFDFINADGSEDSKVISHDEMRERYAAQHKSAIAAISEASAAAEVGNVAIAILTKAISSIGAAASCNTSPLGVMVYDIANKAIMGVNALEGQQEARGAHVRRRRRMRSWWLLHHMSARSYSRQPHARAYRARARPQLFWLRPNAGMHLRSSV